MSTSHLPPNMMTVEDVATRLRLSYSTVYSMLRTGEIPAVKLGAQWRVDPIRLDAWLTEQEPDRTDAALEAVVDGLQGL